MLTPEEVRQVLARLRDPARLVVSLLYGSGLRIHECISLRIKDVDTERREIIVRAAKGGKDCPAMCASDRGSPSLHE